MGAVQQVASIARIERAVGNLFNEVGQPEMHFLFVLQGQRVAFAAQFHEEGAFRYATFYLEAKRQALAFGRGSENVVEGFGQVDLRTEQLQGAVVDFEFDHAACPPPFGSNGEGVARAFSFGLPRTNAQPHSRAKRRISKIWKGVAAAG